MKRKFICLFGFCMLFLCLGVQGISAKAASVDQVSISSKMKGEKQYYVISAKTRSGKTVWKYKTKKYYATELESTTMRTKGNRVYIFEDGRLLIFHKQTGKRMVKTKKLLKGWQIDFVVDSTGSCYAQAFTEDDVYKISAKGKILWKRNIKKTELCWPGKMQLRKKAVRIYYDGDGSDSASEVNGKYIDFDKKTGKILKYKGSDGSVKEMAGSAKLSARQKALRAYKQYLSAKKQKWGKYRKVNMSECEFALKDFDNDKIPELILYYPNASNAECFERVYAYRSDKVKELFEMYSGGIDKIYPEKGICVVSGIHTGGCWEYYYKISKGTCRLVLQREGSDSIRGHEGDFYYNRHYIGKKKVSKSKYQKYRKKLIGKSKNKKSYTYRKNTEKNRKKYL